MDDVVDGQLAPHDQLLEERFRIGELVGREQRDGDGRDLAEMEVRRHQRRAEAVAIVIAGLVVTVSVARVVEEVGEPSAGGDRAGCEPLDGLGSAVETEPCEERSHGCGAVEIVQVDVRLEIEHRRGVVEGRGVEVDEEPLTVAIDLRPDRPCRVFLLLRSKGRGDDDVALDLCDSQVDAIGEIAVPAPLMAEVAAIDDDLDGIR